VSHIAQILKAEYVKGGISVFFYTFHSNIVRVVDELRETIKFGGRATVSFSTFMGEWHG
jgi:hypothetical protein